MHVFERRNGQRFYSTDLKALCRHIRSMDGFFVKFEKSLKVLEKVDDKVYSEIDYEDRSGEIR